MLRVYIVFEKLDYLSSLDGNRAVLVTGGSSMKKFGFLNKASDLLAEANIESIVIKRSRFISFNIACRTIPFIFPL